MPAVASTVPMKPVNNKANKHFALLEKSYYEDPHVSLFEVASYSLNSALLFYVASNMFSVWCLLDISHENQNDKIFTFGFILLVSQIIYNWLDLNSPSNVDRMENYPKNN